MIIVLTSGCLKFACYYKITHFLCQVFLLLYIVIALFFCFDRDSKQILKKNIQTFYLATEEYYDTIPATGGPL